MNERILLIDPDPSTADALAAVLRAEGYAVTRIDDGLQGLSAIRSDHPDLVITDVTLTTMNGFDLCRTVRAESPVPIIILTARADEVDRVVGLELGADDYVTRPFSMREFTARVKSVLRRSAITGALTSHDILRAGDVTVDCERHVAHCGGKTLRLPPKEFQILRALVKNSDRVLSRGELMKAAWADDSASGNRTLDVHIRWLREKIEDDPSAPTRITTVRGVGYLFVSRAMEAPPLPR